MSNQSADQGVTEGKLVQFVKDVAPYCKGDIVRLDSEAQKYVAARVKALQIEGDVYKSKVEPSGDHTEGNDTPVVGAVQAQDAGAVDEPTTVHGGTVVNEQDTDGNANKPTEAEKKARTNDPKNPRG